MAEHFTTYMLSVYAPTATMHTCQGILLSTLPYYVIELPGASALAAGLALAALPCGKLIGEHYILPHMSGVWSTLTCAKIIFAVYALSAVFVWATASVLGVLFAALLWGASGAVFTGLRLKYIEKYVSAQEVAAVLSASDKTQHGSIIFGALLGGMISDTINPIAPIGFQAFISSLGFAALWVCESRDGELNNVPAPPPPQPNQDGASAGPTAAFNLTVYIVLTMICRSARRFVVPMYGRSVLLSGTTIGFCVALCLVAELAVANFASKDAMSLRSLLVAPCAILALGYLIGASAASTGGVMFTATVLGGGSGLCGMLLPARFGVPVSTQRVLLDVASGLGPLLCGGLAGGLGMVGTQMLLAMLGASAAIWVVVQLSELTATSVGAVGEDGIAFSHVDLYNGYEEVV